MPRKGYKCLTVDEKIHSIVKHRAKEANQTIQEYIEYLLNKNRAK